MAANMNISDRTYRSPLWPPSSIHPAGFSSSYKPSPWKQRHKPARSLITNSKKNSGNTQNNNSNINQHSASKVYSSSLGTTTTTSHTDTTTISTMYTCTSSRKESPRQTGTGNGNGSINMADRNQKLNYAQYKQTSGWVSNGGAVRMLEDVYSTPPPPGSAVSIESSPAWEQAETAEAGQGDWSRIVDDTRAKDIELMLQRQAATHHRYTPQERFDAYNWQEKVRQAILRREEINNDLTYRRSRRLQRVCPWKDKPWSESPEVGRPQLEAYQIDSLAQTGGIRNSRLDTTPDQLTTTLSRSPRLTPTRQAAKLTPSKTSLGRPSPPRGAASGAVTPVGNRQRTSTPGSLEKPFSTDTEEWLRQNEFSIWVKKKGRNLTDSQNYLVRDTSGQSGGQSSPSGSQYDHIGPHRDLFSQFNEEKLLHEDQQRATIVLQKFLRGYIQRHRFRRIRDRAILRHAGTFKRFVREYKGLLTRIQKRHNVAKPKTPFIIDDVTKFLDRKEKYEKIFYNMAISDKIPRNLLKRFFKECGHDPTEHMINEAYTNVFKGCGAKADIIFIVDCSASLGNTNFKVQTEFVKEFVTSLHVGEANIRVGYVPYNTDVYQSFDLDMYDDVDSVIQGVDHVRYHKGLTRTDRALIKMREMFKGARQGVPRIGVLITDGKSDACKETEIQASQARKVDKIQMFVVGVGKKTDMAELMNVGGIRGYVFLVPDYYSLWKIKTAIMKRAKLVPIVSMPKALCQCALSKNEVWRPASVANCQFCHWVAPTDLQVDTTRGLYKEEVLEVLWQMYPPRGTGITRQPRQPYFVDSAAEIAYRKKTLRLVDEKEAYYSTSLSFAIKSKLDRDGFNGAPTGGTTTVESSWKDSVGAAQNYVQQEKDRFLKEKEEKEKRDKKAAEKAEREEKGKKGKVKFKVRRT